MGYDTKTVQTNVYGYKTSSKGNSAVFPMTDGYDDYHIYTIDWNADRIIWSLDNKPIRTLLKKDTLNSQTGNYVYPVRPSQIQIGFWDANGKSEFQY